MSAQSVEMESVPLKSDVDKPALDDGKEQTTETTTTETTDDGGVKVTKTTTTKTKAGGFRGLFNRTPKKATANAETNEALTEGDEDKAKAEGDTAVTITETTTITESNGKPQPFWTKWVQKKPKTPKEPKDMEDAAENQVQFGLNMIDRDEHNINEHIKLTFEDILAEPETSHSWDCPWRASYRTFTWVRCFVYKLLSLIVCLPLAIIWAIVFAFITVLNVWAVVPLGRALTIPGLWLAKMWNFLIRSLFDPITRSCGLCLGSVNIRRYGFNQDHTQEMA